MTTDAVGGVWPYSVDLCRSLNGAGIAVLLACLGPRPTPDKAAQIEALPRTKLVIIDEPLEWLAAQVDDLQYVPRRIEELSAAHGVDLLHLNSPSQAAALHTRHPVVVVAHSCVATWWAAVRTTALPREWSWQFDVNAQGLKRADRVIAPTRSHADAMRHVYGHISRLSVVPNAVASAPHAVPASRQARRYVFAAARWWDEAKNAGVLDQAAALMDRPIHAAGTCQGENGQSCSFVHARALGVLTHDQTRAMMREASVFVSPSVYEPFGLVALEAADAGAALILADIATYRELWDEAAIFFDPHDPSALADAIEACIADSALCRSLAARAAERAAAFTPARQLHALLSAYDAAMATTLDPDNSEQ
jgi:glycosyltransferase involved in cell wall biosynthesis